MNSSTFIHLVKTILYRYSIATQSADTDFGTASIGKGVRTPNEIIHHMSDIMIASLQVCEHGTWEREKIPMGGFKEEDHHFTQSCLSLLKFAEHSPISENVQLKLVQGPLSDVLTHIGQLAMISRLTDQAIAGQNYSRVDIDQFIDQLRQ